ncbi:hypothetical protein RZS08_35185, partial [Arthrospira platensis SPKY1]|nr:hypothetical protein [Arthrospira platensis SPKY1]
LPICAIQWTSPGAGAPGAAVPPGTIQWVGRGPDPGASRAVAGPPDAALAAFGRFFGPNGLMDGFFKQHLQPYVDATSGIWRWRGPVGPEQSIDPEALRAFQRAAVVRDALFAGGGQTPLVRFQLVPVQLSGDIQQAIVSLDGQTLAYTAG